VILERSVNKRCDSPVSSLRADSALDWKAPGQCFPRPDAPWMQWLLDPGSLTKRLVALSEGRFQVEVLGQYWSRQHSRDLLQYFGPSVADQLMWSRQVVLKGQGVPWVSAHSLIPYSSLQGPLRRLCKLQNKPLGAFLFRHPTLVRDRLEIAKAGEGWGRRSMFHLFGKPLLVAEFFLPALLDHHNRESLSYDSRRTNQ
jgi:chorismate lyase